MGIFKKGQRLGAPGRFKIKIIAEDGQTFYWHKHGELHTVEEDVADILLAKFNPELFQVLPDGSMTSPRPGESLPIKTLRKEPA
jgi:hypothetical protein